MYSTSSQAIHSISIQRACAAGALAATIVFAGGCATNPSSEDIGTVGGAVVGGVAGSALTGGSTVGTVGGAAAGGLIGKELGKQYDRR